MKTILFQGGFFVSLQRIFDEAVEKSGGASHWCIDGVHPTFAGHQLIVPAWLEAFEKIK